MKTDEVQFKTKLDSRLKKVEYTLWVCDTRTKP